MDGWKYKNIFDFVLVDIQYEGLKMSVYTWQQHRKQQCITADCNLPSLIKLLSTGSVQDQNRLKEKRPRSSVPHMVRVKLPSVSYHVDTTLSLHPSVPQVLRVKYSFTAIMCVSCCIWICTQVAGLKIASAQCECAWLVLCESVKAPQCAVTFSLSTAESLWVRRLQLQFSLPRTAWTQQLKGPDSCTDA